MISFPIATPSLLHSEQLGLVEGLLVRPSRKKDCRVVQCWNPESHEDHGKPNSKRAVTLFQKEHLELISALSHNAITWEQTRRNVLVSGLNLLSLIGHRFRIGDALFEGTCLVDPCHNMESAMGPGTYTAMIGHGGIGARILQTAELKVGDVVQWLGPA